MTKKKKAAKAEADEPIDTDHQEDLEHEIPVKLEELVSEHYDSLIEARVQVDIHSRHSYTFLRRKKSFPDDGPTESVDELCSWLVGLAVADAERRKQDLRYRAHLRVRTDLGPVTRTCQLVARGDDEGGYSIEDVGQHAGDTNVGVLNRIVKTAFNETFRAYKLLFESGEKFKGLLEGCASIIEKHGSGRAEMLRVVAEMKQAEHEHKTETAQDAEMWGFGRMVFPYFADAMFNKDHPGAAHVTSWWVGVPEEEREKFAGVLPDAAALLNQLIAVSSAEAKAEILDRLATVKQADLRTMAAAVGDTRAAEWMRWELLMRERKKHRDAA